MPLHCGASRLDFSAIVCASRKSSRACDSATTIASLPSGVKYMLYGSSTVIALPGLPVFGSIGVRLPSVRPSALLVTHSVCRSHAGTTCCGLLADGKPVDHLQRRRIDHVDVVRTQVRHIDARQRAGHRGTEMTGARLAVHVIGVHHRRHAGHRGDRCAAEAVAAAQRPASATATAVANAKRRGRHNSWRSPLSSD